MVHNKATGGWVSDTFYDFRYKSKKLLSPSYLENLQIFEMKNLEYKQQKFVRNFERNFRKD